LLNTGLTFDFRVFRAFFLPRGVHCNYPCFWRDNTFHIISHFPSISHFPFEIRLTIITNHNRIKKLWRYPLPYTPIDSSMRLFPFLICAYGSSVATGISWKRKLEFRGGSSGMPPPEYGSSSYQQPPLPPDLPPYDDNDDDPYRSQGSAQNYNDRALPQKQHQPYAEGPPPPPPLPDMDGPVDQFQPPYSAFDVDEPDLDDEDLQMAHNPHQTAQQASTAWDSSSTTSPKEPVVDLSVFDKDYILKGLARLYRKKILPLELASRYGHFQSPPLSPSDFDAPPMILLLGQYSVGTFRCMT
jgi:hypothetical protein